MQHEEEGEMGGRAGRSVAVGPEGAARGNGTGGKEMQFEDVALTTGAAQGVCAESRGLEGRTLV
jgi:hypothetical protein